MYFEQFVMYFLDSVIGCRASRYFMTGKTSRGINACVGCQFFKELFETGLVSTSELIFDFSEGSVVKELLILLQFFFLVGISKHFVEDKTFVIDLFVWLTVYHILFIQSG